MKILKYLFTGLICLFMLNACDDDLQQNNLSNPSPETFYLTPAQVQAAVNVVYANLQTRGLYMRHMFFMMDNMAHENAGNPQLEADKKQYLEFAFDPSHGAIKAYWQSCYAGINKANFLLDNEDKIKEITTITDAQRNAYLGEAKFLRGLYYFFLVTRFGDIPLLITVPKTGDGTPKSAANLVYDQIVTDLTEAAAVLPEITDGGFVPGRASKSAAFALLGKTQLYRENYTEAKAAFANVIGKYTLAAKYGDNFLEGAGFEHNSESIFEVEYDAALGSGDQWNSDADGLGLAESTFRGQEYGWNDWFNVYPADNLLDEYEAGDPRYAATFYSNGDLYAGSDTVKLGLSRRAAWRKYQNYYQRKNEQTNSGINPRVIRYADVLLMMAEIENELGNSAAAIGYLDQVRTRVGMTKYADGVAGYPVSTKAEIFAAIVHERKVELAGEQVRFPDLVRWGLANSVLGPTGLNTGFVVGKHEVFPIPQQEINFNNKLTNADQNNGYL
jgi:starch-binding outer membrane protein, SusD/RagB family